MAEDTGAVSFNRMALGTVAVSHYFCSTPQLEVCKIRHRNESVNVPNARAQTLLMDIKAGETETKYRHEIIVMVPPQMQVDVLRSWVSDLVGQNSLLARTVEDLETEATSALLLERQRHSEVGGKSIN
jgi:hypothetical protein